MEESKISMNQDQIYEIALNIFPISDKEKNETFIALLTHFARLVERRKCQELADKIQLLPFGDTASSFAAWVRSEA